MRRPLQVGGHLVERPADLAELIATVTEPGPTAKLACGNCLRGMRELRERSRHPIGGKKADRRGDERGRQANPMSVTVVSCWTWAA